MVAGPLAGGILTYLLPVSSALLIVAASILGFGIFLFVQLKASKSARLYTKESEMKF